MPKPLLAFARPGPAFRHLPTFAHSPQTHTRNTIPSTRPLPSPPAQSGLSHTHTHIHFSGDPLLIEIRARIADAELEQPAARNDASPLRTQAKGEADHAKGDAASGEGGLTGGEAAGAEAGCVVC